MIRLVMQVTMEIELKDADNVGLVAASLHSAANKCVDDAHGAVSWLKREDAPSITVLTEVGRREMP